MKVYICFPEGRAKALTMSYDDGKEEDVRLLEIFNQYGIRGTFNLNYGLMCQDQAGQKHPRIGKERVRELYRGHEVATHTLTHPTIARCPLIEAAEEILEDRKGLERIMGTLVRGHAYPNGSYSAEIKDLFHRMGIAYARVTASATDAGGSASFTMRDFAMPEDWMEWHPTCHHNDPRLMERAEYFAHFQKKQYLKLMYVWGHSYEFSDNDNWEVIEEFCAYMGGRPDIWYATNIEIVDYMEAARNLRFSADHISVYNPSAESVWLQLNDDRCVEIKGGAFVRLDALAD